MRKIDLISEALCLSVAVVALSGCFLDKGDGAVSGNNTDSLFINEVMAQPSGSESDWFELHAAGSRPVDLSAYSVVDGNAAHEPSSLPAVRLAPGGFIVIAAADSAPAGGAPFVPFGLGSSDELSLFKNGVRIDQISWKGGDHPPGGTFGRLPDGTGSLQSLDPTPGGPNSSFTQAPEVNRDTLYEYGGSPGALFKDSVYTYRIKFYSPDWKAKLEENFTGGEEYMPARLTLGKIVLDSIGIRYKGSSSSYPPGSAAKKSLKIRFDKFKNQTFFKMAHLNFSCGVNDPTLMREKIGFDIIRRYLPAPQASYANIYLEGEPAGLYVQIEQVDERMLARYFADASGNLYKAGGSGGSLEYIDAKKSSYNTVYELKTNTGADDWSGFISMLDKLNNTPAADFGVVVSKCLNLEYAMRHLALNMVLSNFDSYIGTGCNYYLYEDPASGRFHIFHWDINESFGTYSGGPDPLLADILGPGNLDERPLLKNILANDSLRQVYLGYIREMVDGPASEDSVAAAAEKWKALISSRVAADSMNLFSHEEFSANIDHDITFVNGLMEVTIPGIKSFSTARNLELRNQLSRYLKAP